MNQKLKITLYVVTAYLAIFGLLFFFAPGVAEMIMSAKLPDRALNFLYGQVVLTFAYVAFMAAQSGESKLWRAVIALTVGHVIVFGWLLVSGISSNPFPQFGPPLIINLIFSALLYFFRK